MSHEQFKQYLQRDKQFLKELYESDSIAKSKRVLNFANDNELHTLCKYLHFLSNGEIKIKKKNFDSLGVRQMAITKKNFESKKSLQKVSQLARKDKLRMLSKLIPGFNNLLAPLFNQ